MALWKHRDLVDVVADEKKADELEEHSLRRQVEEELGKSINNNVEDTNGRDVNSNKVEGKQEYHDHNGDRNPKHSFASVISNEPSKHFEYSKTEIDNRISKHNEMLADFTNSNERLYPKEHERSYQKEHQASDRSYTKEHVHSVERTYPKEIITDRNYTKERANSTDRLPTNIRSSKRTSESAKLKENKKRHSKSHSEMDNDFYDDDGDGLLLKTVKRKEILQQYDSSGTDTASSSSDPYDCIVVDDHLASPRDGKKLIKYRENNNNKNIENNIIPKDQSNRMSFKTFRGDEADEVDNDHVHEHENSKRKGDTNDSQKIARPSLLPRTRLAKTNSVGPTMQTVMKFEQEIGLMSYGATLRDRMKVAGVNPSTGNTYGPWYDLWGKDASVRK